MSPTPAQTSLLELPPLLLTQFYGARADGYLMVAGTTVFLYDYLLTLPAEIRLMWRKNWNLSFFLFVLCRYSAFIDSVALALATTFVPNPSDSSCAFFTVGRLWFNILAISIGEAILILRTRAIWDSDARMTTGLVSFYACAVITPCAFAIRAQRALVYYPFLSATGQPGCFPVLTTVETVVELWASYIIIAFLDAVIMFLTLWKSMRGGGFLAQSTLFRRICRDGILFYMAYFMLSVIIIVLIPLPQTIIPPKNGFTVPYRVLYTIITTRLLLNLREAASSGAAQGTTDEFRSELVFTTQNSSDTGAGETEQWLR